MSGPSSARDQVARLLALVPYLRVRDNVRLDEAAAAFGVSPAQLLADLKVLFMVGLPGGLPDDLIDVDLDALEDPEGDGVIRVSNADYLSRPMRLTPTEATALIVALRALGAGASGETAEVVDRTLGKLEAAAAEGPPQLAVAAAEPALATLRPLIADAVARGRQLRLTYYVPARDEERDRVVDPHALFTVDGHDYLRAWCHEAAAVRVFRLDRIHEATLLDTPLVTEPEPAPDLSSGWFTSDSAATAAVLRLAPQARWVPEYFPVSEQVELPDSRLEVTVRVADPRWLHRLLLRLAPYAEVVSPEELRSEFTALAERTRLLYRPRDVG